MNGCKHSRYEFPDNIEHPFCTNEAFKERNKANSKDIRCIHGVGGIPCGSFERADDEPQGGGEK